MLKPNNVYTAAEKATGTHREKHYATKMKSYGLLKVCVYTTEEAREKVIKIAGKARDARIAEIESKDI